MIAKISSPFQCSKISAVTVLTIYCSVCSGRFLTKTSGSVSAFIYFFLSLLMQKKRESTLEAVEVAKPVAQENVK